MLHSHFLSRSLKRIVALVLTAGLTAGILSGCGSKETVTLSVWCAEEDIPMIQNMIGAFQTQYSDKAVFNITISAESELTCKQTILANPSAAADVFAFAGDQLKELYQAHALLEITENTEQVIADNGGADSGAVRCASVDGKLYACPLTASNGYFLYYDARYLTEDDVKSFDRILEVAAQNGKKFAMDITSGWYMFSFFKGAGLEAELSADGLTNSCNWNTTEGKYRGIDVAEAMMKISSHEGFLNCGDSDFVEGAKNGTIIAGINGTWNSTFIQEAYGEGYAASKLPEYTIGQDQVQMCSFAGYKLMGVSSYTDFPKWSMLLAEWLTSEENQMERFRQRGEAPSNVNAAASAEVRESPAIAALQAQSLYGSPENIGENYWTPTFVFGTVIAAGNPDNIDLQTLLDTMQKDITAPVPPRTE